jgi:hypothetical protein
MCAKVRAAQDSLDAPSNRGMRLIRTKVASAPWRAEATLSVQKALTEVQLHTSGSERTRPLWRPKPSWAVIADFGSA